MKKLHPGAKWLFRLRGYITYLVIVYFLSILVNGAVFFRALLTKQTSLLNYLSFALFGYLILIIILGEIYARMAYNRWMYEFTPTNFKKESGIIWKRYSNIPYDRVQNVDITRGVFARLLGFSTVMIQTAGYSYGGRYGARSEGYIPAVSQEEAEHIREFLMKRSHHSSHSHKGM